MYNVQCYVLCGAACKVSPVSAWSGLHFCLAAPIPPATTTSFCVHIPVIQTLNLATPLPSHHTFYIYFIRDLVLLFSYCRFLYISQYQRNILSGSAKYKLDTNNIHRKVFLCTCSFINLPGEVYFALWRYKYKYK